MIGYGINSVGTPNYGYGTYSSALNSPNLNGTNYYSQTMAQYQTPQFQSNGVSLNSGVSSVSATTNSAFNTPSFKGADTSAYANITSQTQQTEKKSNIGWWIAGGLAVAGLAVCAWRGGGNPIKGAKEIWSKVSGKAASAADGATKQFTIEKSADGSLSCLIPEKTTKITGTSAIETFGKTHGVDLKQLAQFGKDSEVLEYSLNIGKGDNAVTAIIKNGEIAQTLRGGKEVKLVDSLAQQDVDIVSKIKAQIQEVVGRDKSNASEYFNGLTNIRYGNTSGDEIAEVIMKSAKDKPIIEQLTTLERFKPDAKAVTECLNGSELQEILKKGIITPEGKLADGLKIQSFDQNITTTSNWFTKMLGHDGKNVTCRFTDGQLTRITVDGTFYKPGMNEFDTFVDKNKALIDEYIKKVFEDGYVPASARIIKA